MPAIDKNTERFSALISKIAPLYEKHHLGSDIETMHEMLRKASQDNVLALVCGEFKRGKSSFINAFLGEEVCPVDAGIATAAISIIKYGKTRKVVRTYGDVKNLHTEDIQYGDIERYAKGSALEVDNTVMLEIELPSEKLKNGLVLIDTPGVGGLDPRHLFLTLYIMPKADVTFLVADASEPLSVTEINFFKDKVLKYSPSAKIILNKSDLRSEDELSRMMQDIRSKVSRHSDVTGGDIDIIPISSLLWSMYNRSKDEETRVSSNCDRVDNLLAQVVPSYRKTAMEALKSFMQTSLSSITETLEFQLSQIKEPDDSAVEEYKTKLNELNEYKKDITNPNSSERARISKVIRTCNAEVVNQLEHQNLMLSQESVNELLKRPEAEGVNGGDWVLAQINMQLESIAAELDQRIALGYAEVNRLLGSDNAIIPIDNAGFTKKLYVDLTPAAKSISERLCSTVRSALPGLGVFALGKIAIGLICPPVAVAGGVAAAAAYIYKSNRTQNTQQRISEMRSRLQPQINSFMLDLKTYVNQRFDDFNSYLLKKIETMTDDTVEEMQHVMDDLKRIGQDKKAAAELRQKVQGEMNLVTAVQKQVEMLLTNPFSK